LQKVVDEILSATPVLLVGQFHAGQAFGCGDHGVWYSHPCSRRTPCRPLPESLEIESAVVSIHDVSRST
jgi:hypothetical protein